jgi:hypothetical protein
MRGLRFAALLCTSLLPGLGAASAADDPARLRQQAQQLFGARNYAAALAVQRTVVASIEESELTRDGAPGWQTANALSALAWYALFARAPAQALKASQRAHALSPRSLVIETNRAHALLLMRRTRDALGLYLAHKGKRMYAASDKTWEDVIVEDFDALRAAGIPRAHPKVKRSDSAGISWD